MAGEQLADGLGELGAFGGPVVDAVTLQIDAGGIGAGVVGADDLDRTAVAGAVLFDNDDTVIRLFARTDARQANHQHRKLSFRVLLNLEVGVRHGCGTDAPLQSLNISGI